MSTMNASTEKFWDTVTSLPHTANEAVVEQRIVLPLLDALGYDLTDIVPKQSVALSQGTKRGRPFEADFIVYSSALHNRDTSLIVVEAKAPGVSLESALEQGESYAMALRAPILLLTDGLWLQVWQLQPTLENKQIFACSLTELKAQRGTLEQLISKVALITYAQNLAHKNLTTPADFGAYESSELVRTEGAGSAILRQLLSETGEAIPSNELLDQYPQGTVIIAPSGYGKTILAMQVLRDGIKRRWSNHDAALAVDIPLVDLYASKILPIEFALQRIVAHQPSLTRPALEDIARSRGLLLVCDGFERVPPSARLAVESNMRQFRRDFPKSQLFVFSRGAVAPDLTLPHVRLRPLSATERQEMMHMRTVSGSPLPQMPRLLWDLSEIPLILDRIIAFHETSRRFPSRLDELFEHWIAQLLNHPYSTPSSSALRRKVISAIAGALSDRSLTPDDALELTIASGGGYEAFDGLVQCGALMVSAMSVDLVHEALADYFRARTLAALSEDQLRLTLSPMSFDEDSLMPVLLAALIKQPTSRAYVWERLRELSLPRYIDAIRFSEEAYQPFTAEATPEATRVFADDISTSIEALISTYFSPIAAELRGCLANDFEPVSGLCLFANIAAHGQRADFGFSLQSAPTNSVQIEWPSKGMSRSHMNLDALQLGLQEGRYLGATIVRDALTELIQQRRFHGGEILANERTIGRLRFMHEEYGFDMDPQESLADLLLRLQPLADRVVLPSWSGRFPVFTIRSIIDDIMLLEAKGHLRLDWWWLQYGTRTSEQELEGFLREHFRRSSTLYSEIVSTSFEKVARQFPFFQAMPMRWDLTIVPSRWNSRTLYWRWLPVATDEEAGADITFQTTPPSNFLRDDEYDARLEEAALRLGRSMNYYSSGGFRPEPNPGPNENTGRLTGETSVMREVHNYLQDDLIRLFGELPSHGAMATNIPQHITP